jgi:hypothetical protein
MSFALRDGRLLRDAEPFLAVGFNYLPSRAGCELWRDWDGAGLRHDLRAMAACGANSVRVFAFWRDFEPQPGRYAATAFARLREFVEVAAEAGLACVVSLLTLWMNGELLDLPWRHGRSLWRDDDLVAREQAYVEQAAATLAGCENVLAYDLGDELVHVDGDAAGLSREDAAAWQERLADAVRRAHPGALVLMANELTTIVGGHPFGTANRRGLDLAGVHGFGLWSPWAIESGASAKARMVPGFLAALACADGPALIDEIGAYGLGEGRTGPYLTTAAHSALGNGALGALVWCWQDIVATTPPYRRRPHERRVGLVGADGRAKPALAAFERLAVAAAALAGARPAAGEIAVYLPEDDLAGGAAYLDHPHDHGTGAFYAYLLLKRAHLPVVFTRAPREERLLLCPSVPALTLVDGERLERWVRAGGHLYCSPGSAPAGCGGEELFGVALEDVVMERRTRRFAYAGCEYEIAWQSTNGAKDASRSLVRALDATVLAAFDDGYPALTRRHLGKGTATYLAAPFEAQLDRPGRLDERAWQQLYVALAAAAGVAPLAEAAPPQLELAPLARGGDRLLLAVNHADEPLEATITWPPGSTPRACSFAPCDVRLLEAAT